MKCTEHVEKRTGQCKGCDNEMKEILRLSEEIGIGNGLFERLARR